VKGFVLQSRCIRHLIVANDGSQLKGVRGFSSVSPSKLKTLYRPKWVGNAILQSRYLVLGSTHSIAPVCKSTIPPWVQGRILRALSHRWLKNIAGIPAGRSSPCHYPTVASWSWLKVTRFKMITQDSISSMPRLHKRRQLLIVIARKGVARAAQSGGRNTLYPFCRFKANFRCSILYLTCCHQARPMLNTGFQRSGIFRPTDRAVKRCTNSRS
jgi:hypothetical protein